MIAVVVHEQGFWQYKSASFKPFAADGQVKHIFIACTLPLAVPLMSLA